MNRIAERIIAGVIIIAVGVGLYYWNAYESDRSSDTQTVVAVSSVRSLLKMYAQQYDAYPSSNDSYVGGFGMLTQSYKPLAEDGVADCVGLRCSSYALSFTLKTNAYFRKGEHKVTPQGIQ